MIDLPGEKIGCHHTGFEKNCRDLVISGRCPRWIMVSGNNPNTGERINKYDCVDNWGPVLMIENSQMQSQTAASVQSARNEAVKTGEAVAGSIATLAHNLGPTPPYHHEAAPDGSAITMDGMGRVLLTQRR